MKILKPVLSVALLCSASAALAAAPYGYEAAKKSCWGKGYGLSANEQEAIQTAESMAENHYRGEAMELLSETCDDKTQGAYQAFDPKVTTTKRFNSKKGLWVVNTETRGECYCEDGHGKPDGI